MANRIHISFILLSSCLLFLFLSSFSLVHSKRPKAIDGATLRALEDAWFEDEVEEPNEPPFKWQKGPNGERRPPPPGGPKTEMAFLTLQRVDKKATERLATQWTDQMSTGGIKVRAYPIEDDKILFVCDDGGAREMVKVKKFLLSRGRALVKEFEWNSKKSQPKREKEGDVDDEPDAADVDPMSNFNIPGMH